MSDEALIEKLHEELAQWPLNGGTTRMGLLKAIGIIKHHTAKQPGSDGVDEVELRLIMAETLKQIVLGNEIGNALVAKLRPFLRRQPDAAGDAYRQGYWKGMAIAQASGVKPDWNALREEVAIKLAKLIEGVAYETPPQKYIDAVDMVRKAL